MNPAAWRKPWRQSCCSPAVPMTETYTLACWRSPETSLRVTVTPFTRGSRNSKRIVSLATSRTTSATRANRWGFISAIRGFTPPALLGPYRPPNKNNLNLELIVNQFGHRVASQRLQDLRKVFAYLAAFVAHHRQTQDGKLTVILGLHLCHGNVVTVSQPILNAAHHLTLVLETPGFTHQQ